MTDRRIRQNQYKTISPLSSLRKGYLNPNYKTVCSRKCRDKTRKVGWLAEQQIIINSREISRRYD